MPADSTMDLVAPLRQLGSHQFSSVWRLASKLGSRVNLSAHRHEGLQIGVAQSSVGLLSAHG
jgi:hypothetical protein